MLPPGLSELREELSRTESWGLSSQQRQTLDELRVLNTLDGLHRLQAWQSGYGMPALSPGDWGDIAGQLERTFNSFGAQPGVCGSCGRPLS
jgi:hypothetical protein